MPTQTKKKGPEAGYNTSMSNDSPFWPFFLGGGVPSHVYKDHKTTAKLQENMTFGECPTLGHLSYFGSTKKFYNSTIFFAYTRMAKKKET